MTAAIEFVNIQWDQRSVDIEYQWLGQADDCAPLMVFLHEGLGSLAVWKDFPQQLCQAAGCRGLVYSRPGYGRSTPRREGERWGVDFMHRQAYDLLPALLTALQIDVEADPPWFFGHSDGASIALLYAASHPSQVAGLIVVAPHIMVEDVSVDSIEKVRGDYLETDLKQKLARYHDDPDSAFWGWNDIWLLPEFRAWSIEHEIAPVACPLLAVQGVDDEYGTLEQIHGIARRVAQTEVVEMTGCGHSPHRDQPQNLIELAARFLGENVASGVAAEPGFSCSAESG